MVRKVVKNKFSFNFKEGFVKVNGCAWPLERLDEYLFSWHTNLVKENFIKATSTGFKYDWQNIYNTAKNGFMFNDGISILAHFADQQLRPEDIHSACKGNFIFQDRDWKRLITDQATYKSKGIALQVLIGIAYNFGLKQNRIITYLGIEDKAEYFTKLRLFKANIRAYNAGIRKGQPATVYNKTLLVLNELKRGKKIDTFDLSVM